jgi:hypothetical protein
MLFFLICILNTSFLQICKINFGTLGNFVTVGDTFISKLIFKVHTYNFKFESRLNIIGIFRK